MRRILLAITLIAGISFGAKAQELGARFGDIRGGDVSVDAVFSTGEFSRIHTNLGSTVNQVAVAALWDFKYRPFQIENETFYWYLGAGPFLGIGNNFSLGIVGEIGVEYQFSGAPLAFGVDWRPGYRLIDDVDFSVGGISLNLRYVFRD